MTAKPEISHSQSFLSFKYILFNSSLRSSISRPSANSRRVPMLVSTTNFKHYNREEFISSRWN